MRFLTALLMMFWAVTAHAEIPELNGHMADWAHVLSPDMVQRLNEQLSAVQSSYVVLMTIPNLNGHRIPDYVKTIRHQWKRTHPEIKRPVVFALSLQPRFLYIGDERDTRLFPDSKVLFAPLRTDLRNRDYDAVFQKAAEQIVAFIQKDDARFNAVGFPNMTGVVTDAANKLTQKGEDTLTELIQSAVPHRLYVVTVPSLNNYSLSEYARGLFENWALEPDSALLLVVPQKQRIWLEVGSGLKPWLTDLLTTSVLEEVQPALKKKKAGLATVQAMRRIVEIVKTPREQLPTAKNSIIFLVEGRPFILQLNKPVPYEKIGYFAVPFVFMVIIAWGGRKKSVINLVLRSIIGLVIAMGGITMLMTVSPVEGILFLMTVLGLPIISVLLDKLFIPFRLPTVLKVLVTIGLCFVPFYITHPTVLAEWLGLGLKETFWLCAFGLLVLDVLSLFVAPFLTPKVTPEQEATLEKEMNEKMVPWLKKYGVKVPVKTKDVQIPAPVLPSYEPAVMRRHNDVPLAKVNSPAIIRSGDRRIDWKDITRIGGAIISAGFFGMKISELLLVNNVISKQEYYSTVAGIAMVLVVVFLGATTEETKKRSFEQEHNQFYTGEKKCGRTGSFNE